jgi:hypothetical protein
MSKVENYPAKVEHILKQTNQSSANQGYAKVS